MGMPNQGPAPLKAETHKYAETGCAGPLMLNQGIWTLSFEQWQAWERF